MRHVRSDLAYSGYILSLTTVLLALLAQELPAEKTIVEEIRREFRRVVRDDYVPISSEIIVKGGYLVAYAASAEYEAGRSFEGVTDERFWRGVYSLIRGSYLGEGAVSQSMLTCCRLEAEVTNEVPDFRVTELPTSVSADALNVSYKRHLSKPNTESLNVLRQRSDSTHLFLLVAENLG